MSAAPAFRRFIWHLRHGGVQAALESAARQSPHRLGPPHGIPPKLRHGWSRKRPRFPDAVLPALIPRRDDLAVAVILDEFSELSFSYEWRQCALTLRGWEEELESQRPDLLFVESAWAGNLGEWKYQLTGSDGPKPEFRRLLDYCRRTGIPTVFWNKEDPPHYEDFLETARLFDFVFTSDSDRLPSYRQDLGHGNVGVLQFAAQPAIHNPVRPAVGWHVRDVAFAGMYFAHKYPQRREQLHLLLAAAEEATAQRPRGLDIFARHSGKDANYQFPSPYNKHVVGSLAYAQMLSAYKAYKVFLNANSVVESPSMCARRIFEITAAGTTVVSTPSRALDTLWPSNEQFIVHSQEEARDTLTALIRNPDLSGRQLHRAQRRIWSEHTYAHRAEAVISAVLPTESKPVELPPVSLLVATMRPHQLEHVFRTAGSFIGTDVELVLVPHGFSVPTPRVKDLAKQYGIENLTVVAQPRDVPLGDCLNTAVTASSGAVLSKMDDDDFYAPHYLADLLNALKYSGAQLVGKKAHYVRVAAHKATLLRYESSEHSFTASVMGPTISGHRDVFEARRFLSLESGEDTAFLKAVRADGGLIYSADRYNYCQIRGSEDHTWKISDASILGSGDIQFFGSSEEHIVI